MKNIFKTLAISLIMISVFLITNPVQADPPGMPGNHGSSGDQVPGGGAPVGAGIGIMIALSAAYGGLRMKKDNV